MQLGEKERKERKVAAVSVSVAEVSNMREEGNADINTASVPQEYGHENMLQDAPSSEQKSSVELLETTLKTLAKLDKKHLCDFYTLADLSDSELAESLADFGVTSDDIVDFISELDFRPGFQLPRVSGGSRWQNATTRRLKKD
ncbi:hypothetical protein ACV6DN_16800 [Enterobacter asburiae]|jgi:hypothetical protein|uniref:hypothetical protein n=1 Tax=Enterobacter asburiae TaxID=61645 RepID=UPI002175D821|nr:hypothetical protein [Enterobacter asburiae]MCS5453868.1 hypothetical protein [Enterobacter asburiae]